MTDEQQTPDINDLEGLAEYILKRTMANPWGLRDKPVLAEILRRVRDSVSGEPVLGPATLTRKHMEETFGPYDSWAENLRELELSLVLSIDGCVRDRTNAIELTHKILDSYGVPRASETTGLDFTLGGRVDFVLQGHQNVVDALKEELRAKCSVCSAPLSGLGCDGCDGLFCAGCIAGHDHSSEEP